MKLKYTGKRRTDGKITLFTVYSYYGDWIAFPSRSLSFFEGMLANMGSAYVSFGKNFVQKLHYKYGSLEMCHSCILFTGDERLSYAQMDIDEKIFFESIDQYNRSLEEKILFEIELKTTNNNKTTEKRL